MSYLDKLKRLERTEPGPVPNASESHGVDDIGGDVQAVLIDSTVIGAPVWFAFDDGFKSGDDIPVFFASELPFLRAMSEAELRRRYDDKRALGGGWIRERNEEPTRH
jgi:hypothetical protein